MFNKRRFLLINKLNVLIVLLIICIYICPITLSKYESSSVSGGVSSIAYYVVDTNYQTERIYLDGLVPSDVPYNYTFSISNFDSDGNGAETDLYYDLSIVTTTNLPLSFDLYDSLGNSILVSDEISVDDNNTYFRTLAIDRVYMSYQEKITNTYVLSVKFDSSYDDSIYQDIIEGIRIIIDSKQDVDVDNNL